MREMIPQFTELPTNGFSSRFFLCLFFFFFLEQRVTVAAALGVYLESAEILQEYTLKWLRNVWQTKCLFFCTEY